MSIEERLKAIEVPVRVYYGLDGSQEVKSFVKLPPAIIKQIKEICEAA
jgi:hypothetical protein